MPSAQARETASTCTGDGVGLKFQCLTQGGLSAGAKRYRYTGKERDEETGLYYHGARYYAPWPGRWTAADPQGAAAGPNLYVYVDDNPILYVDPNGGEKSIWDTFKPGGTVFESVDSLFNKNESPIASAVLNNLADRGEGIIQGVTQPIKETAEDYADIVYYSTHPSVPGAESKIQDAVERRAAAPFKQAAAAVEGFGETVKRVGEGLGDVAYYSTHSDEPEAGRKIASAVTDIVLDAPTIVLTVEGGASLARGASTGLKTPPKKAPPAQAPKQLPPGPPAPKQLTAGPPAPKQLPPGPAAPKQLPAGPPAPKQLTAGSQPKGLLPPKGGTSAPAARLPRDVAVSPTAPRALPTNRSIGRPSHNTALQNDIANLPRGATDIRVNQQQVHAAGQRVGINRPDLQYTVNNRRYYVEYEGPANPRGAAHQARILANDPLASFILRLIP